MSITITLADGTTLEGLGLNGNNYISESEVDESIFTDESLATVTIEGDANGEEISETLSNAVLVQQKYYDGSRGGLTPGYYLVFREKSKAELEKEAMEAEIAEQAEYITDLELALTELYEATI